MVDNNRSDHLHAAIPGDSHTPPILARGEGAYVWDADGSLCSRQLGIRCNAIGPGGIHDGQPQEFLERYSAMANSKGMLDPQDVCGTPLFLLSDALSYMNGQNLVVDDAWTL
jgi:hypothetical protein